MFQKNLLAVALLSLLNTTLAQEPVVSGASAAATAATAATAAGSGVAQPVTSRAASVISAATAVTSGIASMSRASGAQSRASAATGAATAVGTATAVATRASSVVATSSFSVPETAPTGVVEGDYTGDLRPQVHFSPPVGFMNDPNGCFLDGNGTWHLYYQYNPTALVAGNQHWGHATSPDLYNWTNQPIALFPPQEGSGVFSGSIVIDSNNTSGFFPNQTDGVVAIYTLNTPEKQTQDLARSYDGGYTFTEYENNPVIDINSTQFRDPKVIWYEDHWVMVIAYSVDFSIGIYTSTNLIDWEFSSNVTDVGIIGLQYECPNLIPVPVWDKETGQETGESEWVLIISINPGAPLGGSISEWFPGSFDGYKFTPYDSVTRISDFAKDNYAEQFFYGTESNEAISIAWASNWQYTNKVPTATEGWRSAMSLPRRNYVTKLERTGWAMISQPYELSAIYDQPLTTDNNFLNKTTTVDFSNVTSGAIYLNVNITVPTPRPAFAVDAVLNFTFSSTSGESVTGGYFFGGDNTGIGYLDRGNTNGYTDVFFNDKFTSSGVALAKSFSVVVDRSILEMFVDEGAYSGTTIFFPETPLSSLEVATSGIPDGVTMELEVWGLKGTWGQ